MIKLPLRLKEVPQKGADREILKNAETDRQLIAHLMEEQRFSDALERSVATLRSLREFSDYSLIEFRAILALLLFDLAEVHYNLKDYKQSEKELDTLFRLMAHLIEADQERFGELHILAMELSTRILRSRKKTVEMLRKQQLLAEALLEKVNAGTSTATERLVEALRKLGELTAASGDYKEALRFYNEAIKLSKKRSGGVTRREILLTIEMADVMRRIRTMRPRARRLLEAVLPHSIRLEAAELEERILALLEMTDNEEKAQPRWRTFLLDLGKKISKPITSKKDTAKDVDNS